MKKGLAFAVIVAASLHVIVSAQTTISVGRNNNLNPGIADEFVGDPYLQRQVEFKGVCSPLNPQHCLFGANDYRTINFAADQGAAEGVGLSGLLARLFGPPSIGLSNPRAAAGPPDAWIGLYRCYNGVEGPCVNGLLPGFPTDTTALGTSQPWYGYAAGSDFAVAVDPNGYFPSASLIFDRGGQSLIVFYALRDYNDGSLHPIRWATNSSGQPLIGKVLDSGAATANGQFGDLPSLVADVNRTGSPNSCGEWHAAWTVFANANSGIWWTFSSDCGQTWSGKKKISNPFNSVQRVIMDVDKRPTAQGGGTVYAIFRTFAPDGIAFTKKPFGSDAWTAPTMLTNLSAPAGLCTYDQATVDTGIGDPTRETARALSFGSLATLPDGKLVVSWTERASPDGVPLRGAACPAVRAAPNKGFASPARPLIQVSYSDDGGATWKPRKSIDLEPRCEAATPNNPDGPVEKACGGPGVVQRNAGPQLQPVLKATPHLFLTYREGRGGLGFDGFHSGRNSQLDQRVARLGFDANGIKLLATNQVSQYEVSVATGDIKEVDGAPGFKAYSRAYLPQYKGGTAAFMGDHEDLLSSEQFVFGSSARWATIADVPGAKSYPVWGGDNREAGFPAGGLLAGDWTAYSPPGTGGPSCTNPTIKNSNGYTAYTGDPLDAFAPQPFRPLGGDFNGSGTWKDIQKRSWPVVIRNRSDVTRTFIATIETNSGFRASWDEFNEVLTLGNKPGVNPTCGSPAEDYPSCTSVRVLLPRSSMTLTVFGTGPADPIGSPIRVRLDDLATTGNPDVIVRLNPNPYNPPPVAFFSNEEFHGASVSSPFVQDTKAAPWKNPGPGNPGPGNPGPGNNTLNPGPGNPGPGNPGFTDYTDVQYLVQTQDVTNVTSAYSTFVNIANNVDVDSSHLVQMIISRTLNTPSALNCELGETALDHIVSTIPVPGPGNPGPGNPGPGNPGPGNPGPGNPGPGNPGPGNPGPGNNTFALAPANAPANSLSASAAFRNTAVASAAAAFVADINHDIGPDGTVVGNPVTDKVLITIRYWHCTVSGQCGGKTPESNPGGLTDPVNSTSVLGNTSTAVVSQAYDTNVANDSYTTLEDTTLTVGAPGVLGNDTSGHGGTLSASLFGNAAGYGPFHGSVVFDANGLGGFVYTPNANYSGPDTFIYKITETPGEASAATTAFARVVIDVTPVNDRPTISDIANQTINANSNTGALNFTVGDAETPVGVLTLSGSSSNTTLVPNANIVFGGSGANRTVTVTPAANQSGSATITITVADADSSTASDTFVLTVNPVNYTFFNVQNAPPPSGKKFNSGSAIPMKWQFKNGSTVVDSAQVHHTVTARGPLPNGPIRTITDTSPGTSSFQYDSLTKTWQFNLQTKETNGQNYPLGFYEIRVTPTTPGYLPSPIFQIELAK